jgi:hypothetical protein
MCRLANICTARCAPEKALPMPSGSRHVANLLLRRVLENKPEHLRMEDIEQAVGWTLDQLGRDAVRIDIPAREFSRRRIEARKALVLMRQHRKTQAWRALHRFWFS